MRRRPAKPGPSFEKGDETALQELLDRHGPGRVMFRNTRAAMPGFPKRILHRLPWPPPRTNAPDARVVWLAGFPPKNPEDQGAGDLPDPR
jgi:hypothetical protein